MIKGLTHEAICNVYDYGRENDRCYIVSEHLNAKPLSMILYEAFPLPLERTVAIITRLCDTLRYAHLRGFVHGLLNPTCVYLNDQEEIKVDDFGFVWFSPHLFKIDDVEVIYLSHYLAPEMYKSTADIDGRADIYSVGALFLQMLAGDFTFHGNISSRCKQKYLVASIPLLESIYPQNYNTLANLLLKALDSNPDRRYCNFNAFVNDIQLLHRERPKAFKRNFHSMLGV
jgi:serine/threonine-protein kinase